MDFSATEARASLQELLEQFLTRHSSANDLGLRLHGEQLNLGVRFIRMLKEGSYHLVVSNPPYQGTEKLAERLYIEHNYTEGKSDLYASFMTRGIELVAFGGISGMLTKRNWMFLSDYSDLRSLLIQGNTLTCLHDLSSGAFEDISPAQIIVSVSSSIFAKARYNSLNSKALRVFNKKTTATPGETDRKRSCTLAHCDEYTFRVADLCVVPGHPLVYWWDQSFLSNYKNYPLLGSLHEIASGIKTGDDVRFIRRINEVERNRLPLDLHTASESSQWQLFVNGAAGAKWLEPTREVIYWRDSGIQLQAYGAYVAQGTVRLRDSSNYFRRAIPFSMIGSQFSARVHRHPCLMGNKGASVLMEDLASGVALLNSSYARETIESLNPEIGFQINDIQRLPVRSIAQAGNILLALSDAFSVHESCREGSIEYGFPGPSPWRHAQEWAQQAVDRPEGAPLPDYIEELDPEPPTDHLSFALGVALGRFAPVDDQGQPTTSNQPGILDPTTADLSHALPAGILILDGSLEENDHRDDLGTAAAAPLREAWSRYGSAIAPNRSLRDWLRLDFFKDVHKGMYENRPIHWPLSSSGKTFVAWVNIHRMDDRTLKVLLADHLIPARSRIDGELDDLRQVRDSDDRKAAREADSRIGKLSRWREELQEFITAVEQCADHGAPPTDGRCPAREQDAVYAPDLDDGVMINSAALWPLLEPQWKDPKKWWKELASAQGKKDYDWAHLAMRYWPSRVDERCQNDPSLAVAHGCFWRYHPERAWAWELRLQQEIGPEFRIEEAPYRPCGRDLGDQGDASHRQAWLSQHPKQALAAVEKEATRRMGRGDNRQVVNEMRLLEPGLWSVIPEEVAAMEQRLSDKQGSLFSLRAPDEAEGRAGTGEQSVQGGLFGAPLPSDKGSPMMGREVENTPC